jgi:hypothetical protein
MTTTEFIHQTLFDFAPKKKNRVQRQTSSTVVGMTWSDICETQDKHEDICYMIKIREICDNNKTNKFTISDNPTTFFPSQKFRGQVGAMLGPDYKVE